MFIVKIDYHRVRPFFFVQYKTRRFNSVLEITKLKTRETAVFSGVQNISVVKKQETIVNKTGWVGKKYSPNRNKCLHSRALQMTGSEIAS